MTDTAATSDLGERLLKVLAPGEMPAVTLTNDFLKDLSFHTERRGQKSTTTTTKTYVRIPVVFTDRRLVQMGAPKPNGTVSDYYSMRHKVFVLDPEPVTSIGYHRVERILLIRRDHATEVVVCQYDGEKLRLEISHRGEPGERIAAIKLIEEKLQTGDFGASLSDRKRLTDAVGRIETKRRSRFTSIGIALGVSAFAALFCGASGLGGVQVLWHIGFGFERAMSHGVGSALSRTLGAAAPGACLALATLLPAIALVSLAATRWRAAAGVGGEERALKAELEVLLTEVSGA